MSEMFQSILDAINPDFASLTTIIKDDVTTTADLLTKEASYFETLFDLFVSIGCGFCLIYFLIDLVNTATTTELTIEKITKSIIKLAVSIIVVKEGYILLTNIANLGSALAKSITVTDTPFTALSADVPEMTIWTFISAVGCFLPGLVITFIVFLYSKIIMYSRLVEIGIQIILSPIALADFMNGGLKSSGATFLRKFFALALQGLVIVLIIIIFDELSSTMAMNSGIVEILNGLGVGTAIFGGAVAGTAMSGVFNAMLGGLAATATKDILIAGALYSAIVYSVQAFIMMSFVGKSKQIAMDIVGMG